MIVHVVKKMFVLWVIGDGKPGHLNQSLGLADAISRQVTCETYQISLAHKKGYLARTKAALQAAANLPKPDIVIGAGHATHVPLVWISKKYKARSILVMRPSLPRGLFDLCIAPEHDFPQCDGQKKLILTQGALNRVAPPPATDRSEQMILIGGPSKIHDWDGNALLLALKEITATGKWRLTDSRRTPAGFTEEIRKHLPHIEIFPHQQTNSNWLTESFADAANIWVTEDSVSMIYESLSSGAKVGLLPVPRLKSDSRVLLGLEKIIASGFVTRFSDWLTHRQLKAAPELLREADRCAAQVIHDFGLTENDAG